MKSSTGLFVLLLLKTAPAFGWGCEGHQIIALIARAHVTPAVSTAIDQLLLANPIDPAVNRFCKDRPSDLMADSATWADDIKNVELTGEWHYINVPLSVHPKAGENIMTSCAPIGPSIQGKERPGCIVNAIEYERSILLDHTKPSKDRATALRYLIHFVGDLHQPLHASDNSDLGGNCTSLHFFDEVKPAKLHAIWDYKILERDLFRKHSTQPAYASTLDEKFLKHWSEWGRSKAEVIEWMWQSHRLAQTEVYGDLAPHIPVEPAGSQISCEDETAKVNALEISIGERYFNRAVPVISEQLAKAGYRLAGLLNATLN